MMKMLKLMNCHKNVIALHNQKDATSRSWAAIYILIISLNILVIDYMINKINLS